MIENYSKKAIESGGDITPLLIDSNCTNGTGITNGSIIEINDKIYVNIRHVEYTLYHAEKVKYAHPWGAVAYLHPEDDWKLRTNNYLGVVNSTFDDLEYYSKVDTSTFDKPPLWDFVGLEDARLCYWDEKLFLCGVRRDTTTNGVGRMELSEIVEENGQFKEISRTRIPIPGEEIPDTGSSYCEKNWMPVVDLPYTFVKWCNPVEVVRFDPTTGVTTQVHHGGEDILPVNFDFRGGSQVIPYKEDYRIALCHVTNLFTTETGKKNCTYRHRFVVFNKDWKIIKYTDEFDFTGGHIEFSCGMCKYKNEYLIPYGYQDNTSFLLRVPEKFFEEFIGV